MSPKRAQRARDELPTEGVVRDLAFGGDGVVVTSEAVVFVAGALTGETVRIAIERGRKPLRGRLVEVVAASPDRVEPACPIVDRCGGCPLMRLDQRAQLRTKSAWIAKAVADAGAPEVEPIAAEQPLGYRRRARLRWRGNPRAIGFDVARGHALVDVERCIVLDPVLQAALDDVRARLLPSLSGTGELALALGKNGRAVARVVTETPQRPSAYEAARAMVDSGALAGLVLAIGGAGAATLGDPRERSIGADGVELVGPAAGGFSQAHRDVNETLVSRVAELARPEDSRVLELHAGHGNLTVVLARAARSLVAVESDADACAALRENLAARSLSNVRVVHATAADHLARASRNEHDVLVLDPPRTGLDPSTLARIPALRIPRIVYASCSPPVLARDLSALSAHGYRARRALALEMFPQTTHVESLVLLGTGSP